ncbi:hypothetical protein G6J80_002036 [Listeria monocytogenes]|nr:hypothetical protein [Listeria monocytogenes]
MGYGWNKPGINLIYPGNKREKSSNIYVVRCYCHRSEGNKNIFYIVSALNSQHPFHLFLLSRWFLFGIVENKRVRALNKKIWGTVIFIGVFVFIIGIVGLLTPLGAEKWNFIFENLIWLPFEIGLVVFVLDRLMKKNNELLERKREFNDYYEVAEDRVIELLKQFKVQTIMLYKNKQLGQDESTINDEFENIHENLNEYINKKTIEEGYKMPVFDKTNPLSTNHVLKISHITLAGEKGEIIIREIRDHYSLFIKYMPKNVFSKMDDILKLLETSILFSQNQYLKIGRDVIVSKFERTELIEHELESLTHLFKKWFQEFFELVNKLETEIKKGKSTK